MRKSFILTLVVFSLAIMSCKKDASKFQGHVRYIDSTGAYFAADSAIISLHENDTAKPVTISGMTDSEGIYLIENVPDGIFVVMAQLFIDSNLTYTGITDKMECSGKDFIAAPVDMTAN